MVSCYEITAESSPFTFLVWCAANDAQWFVSGVEIRHDTIGKLFPKRSLPGRYPSRPLALARGIHWCESVAYQLLEADVPEVAEEFLPPQARMIREMR
jgi:hypothetical protein